jgi:predicted metal-dependent phosphoesterase TrpH
MKPDLHCHSYFSDGTLAPAALVQRAIDNGVTHLALTDHDCTDGLDVLPPEIDGISIISGVEISCVWETLEIHVVGLHIDRTNPQLQALLATQQAARRWRVQAMDKKLEALGTPGLMAYLDALPCVAYTRSHVANYLVAQKVCSTRQKAFKTHLSKRGKIFVDAHWCDILQGVAAIKAAGGVAVLAHPGRYPLNKRKLEALVGAFKASGGEAIEGSYPNIEVNMMRSLATLAIDNGLYVSAGSDFHDTAATWTDIGKFPHLGQQASEHAIWQHSSWQYSSWQDSTSQATGDSLQIT